MPILLKEPGVAYRRAEGGESVVDRAVAQIKQKIRSGDFVPGQRLVAADLAAELKISGGPVREALTKLAGEGLVEVQPHRGAVVKSQSPADIVEIYQLREVIEGLAARLAAKSVGQDASKLEAIRLAADKGRDYAKQGNFLSYGVANMEFHEAIYEAAGSSRLSTLARLFSDQIDRLNNRRLAHPSVLLRSALEHDEILAAIGQGNESLAEERMRKHVSSSGKKVLGDD
jgi:DNA-binding GntR family transcriptional regulator